MIEYIHHQLAQWGAWQKTGRAKIGYPRQSAFARLLPSSGRMILITDEEGIILSRAVGALPPDLRVIVDMFYVKTGWTVTALADHLGIHRDTFYARLHSVHLKVQGAMEDIDLGLPVEPWKK